MRSSSTVRWLVAFALLVAPITGCNTRVLKIRLPGFGAGAVDGIWLWRLDATGYKRVCHFELSDPYLSGGAEVVTYRQSCNDGRAETPAWQAAVERLPGSPSTVTLTLLHRPNGPATPHRATAYNGAGESALSTSYLAL